MDKKPRQPKLNGQPNKKKQVTFEDDDFLFVADEDKKEQRILGIKSEYMVFYIAAAIVAIILIFVGALGAFNLFSGLGGGGESQNPRQTPITANNPITIPNPDLTSIDQELSVLTALVTSVDSNNRIISMHNTSTRENINMFATTSSDLRGRFNQTLVVSEINTGDIVQVTYNPDNNNMTRLQILDGGSVWQRNFVTGLSIDLASRTIVFDNNIYLFNNETLVLNQGSSYNIGNIGPLTMVTMRGIDSVVWYIEVERGYGTVQVLNNTSVINGSVQIGREASVPLGTGVSPLDQVVQISEGSHTIVAHGENISMFTKDIVVLNGQTIQVDLSELEITAGSLNINVTPSDATVSINGQVRDVSEPLTLAFGPIRVIAQYNGYVSFDEVIEFETHNQLLPIVLLEQVYVPTIPPNIGGGGFGIEPRDPNTNVEFRSIPSGASVFVDGVFQGQTPFIANLYHGQRSIAVQLEGFFTTQDTRVVTMGPMLPFEYELQPIPNSLQPGVSPPVLPTQTPLTDAPVTSVPGVQPPTVTPPIGTPVIPDPPAPPPNVIQQVPPANIGYNPPVIGNELTTLPNPSN